MKKNKYPTYSRNKYEGHNNEEIISLHSELEDVLKQQTQIKDRIDNIQSNCVHVYKFVCSGPYEDSYCCIHCGHKNYR